MPAPAPVYDPPYRITRASHLVHTMRDPATNQPFHTQMAGLVVTFETQEANRR